MSSRNWWLDFSLALQYQIQYSTTLQSLMARTMIASKAPLRLWVNQRTSQLVMNYTATARVVLTTSVKICSAVVAGLSSRPTRTPTSYMTL